MRSETVKTFAHQTSDLAELVCSNSLRSDDIKTAIGILHQEMRILDSLIMRSADKNSIPAGSALAVDRKGFSQMIEDELLKTNKVKTLALGLAQKASTLRKQQLQQMNYFSSDFKLGILGGGQLGKMLLSETRKFDIQTFVLEPSDEAPAHRPARASGSGTHF
mgnify:CR=1 FL=1